MQRVGIGQLWRSPARTIRRVKAGESLEITQRGVPMAWIEPPIDREVYAAPQDRDR